jgi:hypothetical protein
LSSSHPLSRARPAAAELVLVSVSVFDVVDAVAGVLVGPSVSVNVVF